MIGWVLWLAFAATGAPPLETLACTYLTKAIELDGAIDEGWESAPPCTSFRLWGAPDKSPTCGTSVRVAYDKKYLYFLFECTDSDIYCLYDERDAYLWESDVVELFLVPDATKSLYYEFQVAPNGALFDARFISRGGGDFRRWAPWNCAMEARVSMNGTLNDWHDTDSGYVVECRIPWSAFDDAGLDGPPAGQRWRVAAARADFSVALPQEERSATANLVTGNPHADKDGYFTLAFGEQPGR